MGIASFNTMADVLASEGVINYDASAYVMGKKPRYIGKPATYANSGYAYPTSGCPTGIYSNPYTNAAYTMTTSGDSFLKSTREYSKGHFNKISKQMNPEMAKGLGVGAVILASVATIAGKFKKHSGQGKGVVSNLLSKIGNSKIAQKIKGTQTAQNAANAVKKFKIPTKYKLLGVAVLTLFGAYKVATHEKNNQVIMGSTNSTPQL